MNYSDFENKILRRGDGVFKVRNSWGVYDAYKHIRKNKWYNIGRPVKEQEFYSIIRKVNILLAKNLSDGENVIFPSCMGCLELRKRKAEAYLKDDKVEINYPVDWKNTLVLWYKDEEEYNKRTLIRRNVPFVYKIAYNKRRANYQNKGFYKFVLNRKVKRALRDNIEKGKIDALW